jgi:hypothetical protein
MPTITWLHLSDLHFRADVRPSIRDYDVGFWVVIAPALPF